MISPQAILLFTLQTIEIELGRICIVLATIRSLAFSLIRVTFTHVATRVIGSTLVVSSTG